MIIVQKKKPPFNMIVTDRPKTRFLKIGGCFKMPMGCTLAKMQKCFYWNPL